LVGVEGHSLGLGKLLKLGSTPVGWAFFAQCFPFLFPLPVLTGTVEIFPSFKVITDPNGRPSEVQII